MSTLQGPELERAILDRLTLHGTPLTTDEIWWMLARRDRLTMNRGHMVAALLELAHAGKLDRMASADRLQSIWWLP